jgi:hypothetical protein
MILRILVLSAVFLWFPSAFKRWTHGFRLHKCAISWPNNPAWDTPEPDDAVRKILKEKFTYFNKGAQSYVFLSADQKYVLKLFRFDACRIPFGQTITRKVRKWIKFPGKHFTPLDIKVPKTFTSCKLSYDLAPDLTGVICVHLNPAPSDLPPIRVKDRLGMTHRIDPAKYRFVLQRKADPLLPTLLHAKDPAPLLDSYLALLSELSDRGLANLDRTMGRNFGFIEGQAVELDFGNFALDPSRARHDPAHFSNRLMKWLKKHRPDTVAHMEEKRGGQ